MAIEISKITDDFCVSSQITTEDVNYIVDCGFKSIINNRPDGEGGDSQPNSVDIQKAVEGFGLTYAYIPVVNGQLTQAQVDETTRLLETLPKPILAFCRSGARSTNVFMLAQQNI
jgi:uncharacterized protein (TIGR01244 family)